MIDVLIAAYMVQSVANTTLGYCDNDVHMAAPEVTEAQGCGDCEDLALWRYHAMLKEGVPTAQLQISLINDGAHAVLDACDSWRRCYRMEHGRDVYQIERLPDAFINPENNKLYTKGKTNENDN